MPKRKGWRHRLAAACLALTAPVFTLSPSFSPATAQTDDPAVESDAEARDAVRDSLFRALTTAPDALAAREIVARIWLFWFQAPDAKSAALMADIQERRQLQDYTVALDLLDELIEYAPDWAEAWNQRATIRFLVEDFDGSLADIDHVLPLEPKHFGALSGQALILLHLGRKEEAQAALRRAVKINPYLAERALLEPEPEGEDI